MPHLVAIDLPGGPGWVAALQRVWDRGDAVLPVDGRLPPPARATLLQTLRPTRLLDESGEHQLEGLPCGAGDALVMATSGSTGTPKGVILTHAAVAASAEATSRRLATGPGDTWVACLPLAHVGGLSVVTRALHTGAGLVVHDGFDAARVTAAAHAGATAISLVATALARIDPSCYRVIVLGGSRPPADRPPNCHATYGLTETGSGVVYDGRPLDGVEVMITAGGEILLRGPMLTRGYRDGSTPVDAEGWLHTGDLGRWNDDGTLHVLGRAGDLIITGGENVWPDAVEAVLATHPNVAEAAVRGEPDEEWGQRVEAWVVPAGDPPTLDALRAHAREHLPAFCAPKAVHIVDALPRTALGKIQRHLLG
ncbi:MAG: long-chain fatty acid--CoA ligase [Ilumatobacter sp.]|nr:long-chain fatty acid--CoA ligase [Ilumatobacter sp.]MCB0985213.1 long-chain fatty acid--CoA ligase [Ilumatobacter sp.]